MTLETWLRNRWVDAHSVTPRELNGLLGVVDRDLASADLPGLPDDWRFNMAYSAVLQLATIALAAAGFRASRDQHHYRTLQSLKHTISADADLLAYLDNCRKKRNLLGYVQPGVVSPTEATELLTTARELRTRVLAWLSEAHAHLLHPPPA